MVWVPGASMQALAIQGLASHSPTPKTPPSVRMTTTKLSCAEEVKLGSKSGARRTWHSTSVIFRRVAGSAGCGRNGLEGHGYVPQYEDVAGLDRIRRECLAGRRDACEVQV